MSLERYLQKKYCWVNRLSVLRPEKHGKMESESSEEEVGDDQNETVKMGASKLERKNTSNRTNQKKISQ